MHIGTGAVPAAVLCLFLAGAAASAQGTDSFAVRTYETYLGEIGQAGEPAAGVIIPGPSFSSSSGEPVIVENLDGRGGVLSAENGFLEWEFVIEEPGLYNLGISYYPIEGKTAAIERELAIDGEVPFREARTLVFQRVWINRPADPPRDNRGNDLKPRQVESPRWRFVRAGNLDGYYTEPYRFYLGAGRHTVRLTSLREPMVVERLELMPVERLPSYEEAARRYERDAAQTPSDVFLKVQGEDCAEKSDPILYPVTDRSSPATEPYHVSKIRLNTIGGTTWTLPGQWITWEFEVPETGLYELAAKVRQNQRRGVFSNRKLLIDGEVPFLEAQAVRFVYGRTWRTHVFGDDAPYLFHLERGRHTVTLEITLGEMAPLLKRVESNVLELNTLYRKILMVTGAVPDPYRDYRLDVQIPGLMDGVSEQASLLRGVLDDLIRITGERGSEAEIIEKLVIQLEDFLKRPETIPRRMDSFSGNIGALGSWLLMVRDQPLEIDYLMLATPETRYPKAEAGWLARVFHEIGSFFASFTEDYSAVGNSVESGEALEVWVLGAREQAQLVKPIIDESFTPDTGIGVNLRLVDEKVLLPATLSGQVSDVVLNVKRATPVNFALRNAVQDLSTFEDFPEVSSRFFESALVPYRLEDGVYALPEQEYFDVLFYRKDILAELGIGLPQTWDDLYRIIPVLQKHNLDFGLPVSTPAGVDHNVLPPNPTFSMLLFQSDGEFYNDRGRYSGLDSEASIRAFTTWTQFFTAYKLDLEYDFGNRFRTGEMPLAIQRYNQYNMLAVFAPELRGLWDFGPVPGTRMPDGTIRREVISDSTACIMMERSPRKAAAWEFLKWWTADGTQTRFGRELESLLGAGGRYPTANVNALTSLPWPVSVLRNLQAQWPWVRGIPELPGGYYTGRHLDNAFRKVVYDGDNPRDTLLDYVDTINDEIRLKRKEFGLE